MLPSSHCADRLQICGGPVRHVVFSYSAKKSIYASKDLVLLTDSSRMSSPFASITQYLKNRESVSHTDQVKKQIGFASGFTKSPMKWITHEEEESSIEGRQREL